MREKWVLVNIGYMLCLVAYLGWFRPIIESGEGNMTDFVRWIVSSVELALPKLGVAGQAAVLWTNGNSVEGVLQLFGDLIHSVRLSNAYRGQAVSICYIVDPFHQTTPDSLMNSVVDSRALPKFDDQSPVNNAGVRGRCIFGYLAFSRGIAIVRSSGLRWDLTSYCVRKIRVVAHRLRIDSRKSEEAP